MKPLHSFLLGLVLTLLLAPLRAGDRLAIKVLVVSCFEVGEDSGDAPGEFQFWVEREKLTSRIEVPGSPHVLRHNAAGLYGTVASNVALTPPQTGPDHLNVAQTSELIMALCLDPRLDLRQTYWIINGIAGIDPLRGSIGSAVWAENVIDGDALREIDEAEMPKGWPYGLFAIGTMRPNTLPKMNEANGGWGGAGLSYTMNFPLNRGLAQWAYQLSKDVALPDSAALKAWRMKYTGFPLAQEPPKIILGDSLGSTRYWHGAKRTQWARDWVHLWTNGTGHFTTTAMEHQDFMATLTRLSHQGYLDLNRVLMLRPASNYCMPPPGQPVESTIGDESLGTLPAFEANYRAGSVVAHELLAHWPKYAAQAPGAAPAGK